MLVKSFATLRDLMGTSTIQLEVAGPSTVGQILHRLSDEYPALREKLWNSEGDLSGYVKVFLHGRAVQFLNGLDTPVTDEDTLSLFPPVGGG
jgi:sulfur-carrier protein